MLGEDNELKEDDEAKLYEKFPKYLAWFVLFYSVFNGACMPPWIMSIPAEKYLRISWRFIL